MGKNKNKSSPQSVKLASLSTRSSSAKERMQICPEARIGNWFSWGMCAVYFFAFSSLYFQAAGLYGDRGVLPVRSKLKAISTSLPLQDQLRQLPSLVIVLRSLGFNLNTSLDLIGLLGMLASVSALLSKFFRNTLNMAFLWILYQSYYQVGQVFMHFQWDTLLLEAGALAILVSPLPFARYRLWELVTSNLRMWPVRWLFFRLMFQSGIVKLTSGCPTWWGASALDYHFESQCIPNAFAWYAHQLPQWINRLGFLIAMVVELVVPFGFFLPSRCARWSCFWWQLLLQVSIILTGNYNFFNLLAIVLSVSILNESDVNTKWREMSGEPQRTGKLTALLSILLFIGVPLGLFTFNFGGDKLFDMAWRINIDQLRVWLPTLTLVSIAYANLSLVVTFLKTIAFAVRNFASEKLAYFWILYTTLLHGFFIGLIFYLSLTPYASIAGIQPIQLLGKYSAPVTPFLVPLQNDAARFSVVNSYGLFRRMTGVGGRPELVIEAANAEAGPWTEVKFLYKPTKLDQAPPFIAPHQPRLDWQMWFAALGDINSNKWLLNLAYRILQGEPSVVGLLADENLLRKQPKFLRIKKYIYHYTSDEPRKGHYSESDWWWREKEEMYLTNVSLDSPSLVKEIKLAKLPTLQETKEASAYAIADEICKTLRYYICGMDIRVFMASVVIGSWTVGLFGRKQRV